MAFLVVLHPLIDVRVPPSEHAVHEDGKLMGDGRNGFGRAECAAEAPILGTEITLAVEQGAGREA